MGILERPIILRPSDILCHTYDMDEAGDKDSFLSLFEPMSLEALDQQKSDFPLNVPLTDQERQNTAKDILNNGVSVKLRGNYNNEHLRNILIENMLLNSWFLPDRNLGNRIPLKGVSLHRTGSSTIPLTMDSQSARKVDVVIKPFHAKHSKADAELTRLEEVKRRGIPTIEPLGTIDINDSQGHDTYILTVLKKGIVPLQKIHFEHLHENRETKFKQLKELLEGLGGFLANMHNQGIAHQDLHLGNIAYDLNQETPGEFVIYDLEKALVMAKDKLGLKNKMNGENPTTKLDNKFHQFEKAAIGDIANLAANIAATNERISYDAILHHLVLPYWKARQTSHQLFSEDEFIKRFDEQYKKKFAKAKRFVDWNRSHVPEIVATQTNPTA